jgi:hypothetical protein
MQYRKVPKNFVIFNLQGRKAAVTRKGSGTTLWVTLNRLNGAL